MANRRRRRNRGGGLQIAKDLSAAQNLADRFNLIPTLGSIDASRSPEVADLIAQRKDLYGRSLQRDPDQQALLDLLKGGLGGLTAEENTALRESQEEGINRDFATQLRALASRNAQAGVRGGAAQAGALDLGAERLQAQRGLGMDILAKNIDVQNDRRQAFGDFLNQLVTGEFNRQGGALNSLENTTQGARLDELNRQLFNLGQDEKQQAGRSSTLFGLVGLRGGRRAQKKAFSLEQQRIEAEKEAAAAQREAFMQSAQSIMDMVNANSSEGGI